MREVCPLTASFTIYLLRPVTSGELRAAGRIVHASRRQYVAESELVDGDGGLVARGSGTFMRSTIALGPEVGYE